MKIETTVTGSLVKKSIWIDIVTRQISSPLDDPIFNETILAQTRNIIDLTDQVTREALIKLGWTPPADERN